MQDIAGVRLVIEGTRLDQDRVVERILELFPDARMVDRREKPSYGYRAVHVIVRTRGCLVEVQVRTELQDSWAQGMERLADIYGRQIRYGEPPTDADAEVAPGMTRQEFVDSIMLFGQLIDAVERKGAVVAEAKELDQATDVDATIATYESLRARWDQADSQLGRALEQFSELWSKAADGGVEDQP
jgi:ppGpp synthetase/RelA/SpoT-type nucleotidyltranferase